MSKLRNRITKATFWVDGDLLRWHRDKRFFYHSLWALAEDSSCVEDDPFGWKCAAWPSPIDTDMSVERIVEWRDELVAVRKAVPYESDGKRGLYLPDMARHENPRNPQRPDLPLPSWVEWIPNATDPRKGSYSHHFDPLTCCTTYQTEDSTVPALPCPALSCPALPSPAQPRPALSYDAERDSVESYFTDKIDRDATPEERSFIDRMVPKHGADSVKVALGYAIQEGARSICGYARDVLETGEKS